MNLSIKQHGHQFVIYDKDQPIVFPNEDNINNKFSSLEDAVRILDIIHTQNYISYIFKEYGL